MNKIVVVDYGMCNVGSVKNMLHHLGYACLVSGNLSEIKNAEYLILPGVGNFGYGMQRLHKYDLDKALYEKVIVDKTPILGICLGMQLMMDYSEEGDCEGLGFIRGNVRRLSSFEGFTNENKIPHMGWNRVIPQSSGGILRDIMDTDRFYFVHSYAVKCDLKNDCCGVTKYGTVFDSVIQKDNIVGVQFHPEKSLKFGMKIFRNFLEIDYGL